MHTNYEKSLNIKDNKILMNKFNNKKMQDSYNKPYKSH